MSVSLLQVDILSLYMNITFNTIVSGDAIDALTSRFTSLIHGCSCFLVHVLLVGHCDFFVD